MEDKPKMKKILFLLTTILISTAVFGQRPQEKQLERQQKQVNANIFVEAEDLFYKGKYKEAEVNYKKSIKKCENDRKLAAYIYFQTGECCYQQGKNKQAILEYEKAINNYPESELCPEIQYKIGIIYSQIKQYKKAAKEFEKLISKYPESRNINMAYGQAARCRALSGSLLKAKKHYDVARKNRPKPVKKKIQRKHIDSK